MFNDEFYFNPKIITPSLCMKYEGEGEGGDGDGNAAGGGGGGGVSILDDGGNFTEDFYNTFDENDRATVSRYKTPNDLAKGHMELRRTFDKPADRVVVMPDENSTEEEITAFNQKWGVPQDPNGYEYKPEPELAEKSGFSEEVMKGYFEKAKELQLNRKQLQGMADFHLNTIAKQAGDFELIQQNNEVKALEEDNEIADKYFGQSKDERIARADMLLRKYGNIEIKNEKGEVVANAVEKLLERYPRMKHDPYLTMIVDKIAEDMSPARLKGLAGITNPTNAAIKTKIAALRDNPAYSDIGHPEHKSVHDEVMKLYAQMG